MVTPFVEGWDFVQTLGEGAYGEVKLAVNRSTQEAVAVKILILDKAKGALENVRKEVCVHRMMNDDHIVRFYGQRKEGSIQYLFLEYMSGGELFDRIEPDIGMPGKQAHRYFCQLIAGVEYLHRKGVTHRDLKPENLLLDDNDNLKISDFGLATVYRHQGKERLMNKCCGTPPYVAPEVLKKEEYHAEPADFWSCGIILVAMLGGELPWDEPTNACKEFSNWLDRKMHLSPWKKIDPLPLALLRKILNESPSRRCTIATMRKDRWYSAKTWPHRPPSSSPTSSGSFKRRCSGNDLSPTSSIRRENSATISSSQPIPLAAPDTPVPETTKESVEKLILGVSFSQPVHMDSLLLSSQIQSTPGGSQTPMQRLVKRMTRVFTKLRPDEAVKKLTAVLEKMGYVWKLTTVRQVTISSQDRRKNPLIFKAHLHEMDDKVLIDFRLSKGDGIEFKRHFLKIKGKLAHITTKVPPLTPFI
ncbi:serine/threonine-protein kinase Chk1-like [Acanthaster planci]|uniref:Serine/threonine-protein kinase CHK1 n=1 Tax=Acanthaster planci TaxID=133434 RepID=A0A8B7Z8U1_ACAPL|nr:serine/threonine-protein kinase Chk1-like [Acanthaster planci]XP_022101376.1 serine/threonine-protein kinase Chk1-like [Acanthaster planci]XP_022101377.1 serine/threonine-protein kinase Chk1-like [Acanthaster planci]XP_022101378.1 serine/threonine-protein kinase Chk1-like [Acanthaster planci]